MMSHPHCPRCKSARTDRRRRAGLWQWLVLNRLGLFPWACNECHTIFHVSERGDRKKQRAKSNAEIGFRQAGEDDEQGPADPVRRSA